MPDCKLKLANAFPARLQRLEQSFALKLVLEVRDPLVLSMDDRLNRTKAKCKSGSTQDQENFCVPAELLGKYADRASGNFLSGLDQVSKGWISSLSRT